MFNSLPLYGNDSRDMLRVVRKTRNTLNARLSVVQTPRDYQASVCTDLNSKSERILNERRRC